MVTGDTAMRHSAVYACVRVLSETFAMLPFLLTQTVAGRKQYITDHWLYRLLSRAPNGWQTAFEWREMMMGHLALRGNAYNRIVSDASGEVTALVPVHPDRIQMEVASDGVFRYKIRGSDGTMEIVPRGMIWHLRGLSSDGYMGLSPIALAADTIGLGLQVQDYGGRFFANNGRPGGGWIEHPTQFKTTESRQVFKESWQAAQTGVNQHKTAVLEYGMKYHDLPLKNNDSQFLETRSFQVIDICRIFRVPPHLVADLTRGTFSNIEHQSLEFMAYSMAPWAERIEGSIENNFLPDGEGWEVEFDFTNLMRGDSAARTAYYAGGIQWGWMTRNEAREAEGYEPLDDLDEPLMPLNMVPANTPIAPDGTQLSPGDSVEQEDPPEDNGPSVDRRPIFKAIAMATAERVVRKEIAAVERLVGKPDAANLAAKFFSDHVKFIAEVFGGGEAFAKEWCDMRAADAINSEDLRATLRDWKQTGPALLADLMTSMEIEQ